MFKDDFIDLIDNGAIVDCKDIEERNNTLRLLVELGYELGSVTAEYLLGDTRDEYLCPGMGNNGHTISCWRDIYSLDKKIILYVTIADIAEGRAWFEDEKQLETEVEDAFKLMYA